MLDLDIGFYPGMHEYLKTHFRVNAILPASDYCMLKDVEEDYRPFFGPNIYIAGPSAYTRAHCDGYVSFMLFGFSFHQQRPIQHYLLDQGTVDSAHLNLKGYNEVVMLKCLQKNDELKALKILNGTSNTTDPHGNDAGSEFCWPTCDAIKELEQLG